MALRLTFFFTALITLALVHVVATEFYLYWRYAWLDIPMHFLGGVVCIFGLAILPFFRIRIPKRYRTRFAYLIFAFLIGVLWEIFEYVYDIMNVNTLTDLIVDTGMDLTFDILGALFGYTFIQRCNMF